MQASDLIANAKNPAQWRKHARSLRRSADALWERSCQSSVVSALEARSTSEMLNLDVPIEYMGVARLLYGLSLETALKGWIVEKNPSAIEIKVTINGAGEALHAELKNFGVPSSQGHNLLALAEAAGLFTSRFHHVLKTECDRDVMRNVCRDLGETVVWRGRYPVPLASSEPIKLNPNVPGRALAHYLRDWLDPVLNELLQEVPNPTLERTDNSGAD